MAFRILSFVGGPPLLGRVPDSRFPIELATFEPSSLPAGVAFNATTGATVGGSHHRGVPPSHGRSIEVVGVRYTALPWIGPDASDALRAAFAQVISSPRFPRLRPGRMVNNFAVLRTASHYPVGSFTLIRALGVDCHGDPRYCVNASAPVYLVPASGRLQRRT